MNNTLINVEIRLTNVEKGLAKVEELEGRVFEVEKSQTFISEEIYIYEEINNKIILIKKKNVLTKKIIY